MIEKVDSRPEWIEILKNAIVSLNSNRNALFLKPVSPLFDNLKNIDFDGLVFYSLPQMEIKKENKAIKVPEQLNLIFSSYFVSCEKAEILKVNEMYLSNNSIHRIGNKTILGVLAPAKLSGIDVNNKESEINGIVFNPGWSIPININSINGNDLLILLGKFNFVLFYDMSYDSIILSELK